MSTRMSKNNDNNYERGDKCLVLFYFTYVSIKKSLSSIKRAVIILDKPSSKITIKINGQENNFSNDTDVSAEPSETGKQLKVSSWEEKVKAEKEMAASEDKNEEETSFPWILPDDEEDKKENPKIAFSKNNSRTLPPKIKNYVISIIFAVILGLSFGVLALQFISNDSMPVSSELRDVSKSPQVSNASAPSGAENIVFEVYMVQAGKFTKKEGAETVSGQIKAKGLPSVIVPQGGDHYVFVGAALDKKTAEELKNMAESHQIETFVKKMKWEGKVENEKTKTVVEEMLKLSSSFVNGTAPEQEKVESLLNEAGQIKDDSILAAVKKLQTEKSANEQLWSLQQSLLDFFEKLS
ncbi:SPOR domain-containing protein [Aeribacillus pallidus]|nr:SPOR domain-containing protein [Aeribacillus pallidus]